MLQSISPVDGRYADKTQSLSQYFSEYALIKYRVWVEIEYLKSLATSGIHKLAPLQPQFDVLDAIITTFNESEAQKIKDIEKITNHDVKAVEYYLRDVLTAHGLEAYVEFIHFGLTSQDINNTAFPLMTKDAIAKVILPSLREVIEAIQVFADQYAHTPMLAHTHGQPASPTTFKKEMYVFVDRLNIQYRAIEAIPYVAKFGGATGNLNAHKLAFPHIDWIAFADKFVTSLSLDRLQNTTQISHYDQEAALFQAFSRIDTILIDFCRDIWTYISMEYIKQKAIKNEVGSSAMPHKVNPIDFENAEGNLMLANSLFHFLAEKLPVSRLQRDLTDSTVLRNVGMPFAYCLIAYKSIIKGISKLSVNTDQLAADLDDNWAVIAEAIQTILRREGTEHPYELLKSLTRGKHKITAEDFEAFIHDLPVSTTVKEELQKLRPDNYIGYGY